MASFILAYLIIIIGHLDNRHMDSNKMISICYSRCTGSAYCNACKTCEYCAYCNSGGSCGVCSGSDKEDYGESGRSSKPERSNTGSRTYLNNGSTWVAPTVIKRSYFTVTSGRAYFHDSPNYTTQRRAYLVKSEVGQIQSYNGIFIYTEFQNARGIVTKGWIKLSDIRVL